MLAARSPRSLLTILVFTRNAFSLLLRITKVVSFKVNLPTLFRDSLTSIGLRQDFTQFMLPLLPFLSYLRCYLRPVVRSRSSRYFFRFIPSSSNTIQVSHRYTRVHADAVSSTSHPWRRMSRRASRDPSRDGPKGWCVDACTRAGYLVRSDCSPLFSPASFSPLVRPSRSASLAQSFSAASSSSPSNAPPPRSSAATAPPLCLQIAQRYGRENLFVEDPCCFFTTLFFSFFFRFLFILFYTINLYCASFVARCVREKKREIYILWVFGK